jgi:hypothetical protein
MEFGTWWGQNLVLFENLRAINEPYNYTRKVIGFDTFEGYPELTEKDVKSDTLKEDGYIVSENYMDYLEALMDYHEKGNIMEHIKKHKLVKGNASATVKKYLKNNPKTTIALTYFDMALYEPTKNVLQAILPHLIKGSVIVMDELNNHDYQGETIALKEVLGLDKLNIFHSKYLPDRSYIIFE